MMGALEEKTLILKLILDSLNMNNLYIILFTHQVRALKEYIKKNLSLTLTTDHIA